MTRWGTGALNIDGCRIGEGGQLQWAQPRNMGYHGGSDAGSVEATSNSAGRWPANVILDESQAAALDQMSGESVSPSQPVKQGGRAINGGKYAGDTSGNELREGVGVGYGDNGGASRFFYTPKASTDERVSVNGISHPTVKPLSLMRWLVKLINPPDGTCLDLFAGSGTTGEACILEGFKCILIEREPDYLPLITQRINRRRDPIAYITAAGEDLGLFGMDVG